MRHDVQIPTAADTGTQPASDSEATSPIPVPLELLKPPETLRLSANGHRGALVRLWPKLLRACYLRRHGWSQRKAAEAAGVPARTLHRYEHRHEVWSALWDQARQLWPSEVEAVAEARLLLELRKDGSGSLAQWILLRTRPELREAEAELLAAERQPVAQAGVSLTLVGGRLGYERDAPGPVNELEVLEPSS